MHHNDVCVRVHPEDFDRYLKDGYVFGGLPRQVDKSGSKNPAYGKAYNKGKCWIHKEGERLLIPKSEYSIYKEDGWLRGMRDTSYRGRADRLED